MSNMAAQYPALNRGIWKQLEDRENRYAAREEKILVVTGPVFNSLSRTLPSGEVVPKGFYKIMVKKQRDRLSALAFYFPNIESRQGRLDSEFMTSIDHIEEMTMIDFFPKLDDDVESRLESQQASRLW